MMQPANPNLLPVSEADREAYKDLTQSHWSPRQEEVDSGQFDASWQMQRIAAHRLAAEQSKDAAFVAMLEGMKRPSLWADSPTRDRNAVIDEAIANAKALGEGREG